VNGTPADCVALGISQWDRVDLVLSGVNLGPNLGNGIWHSETLAAAKQAALMGVPGIALSISLRKNEPDFEALRPALDEVLSRLLPKPPSLLLNVNPRSRRSPSTSRTIASSSVPSLGTATPRPRE
jgi:5'-nucleotidase